ncbi:MAG: VWA domain-containing protein, partial [Acidobacteria bacterium]|nr:VWA domain-containing protein [Acidobacteriota bacterium]
MRALVSIAFVASIVGGSAAFPDRSLQGQSSAPLPSAPTSGSQSPAPTPGTNSQPSGPGAAQSTPPIKTAGSQAASPATPITILKVTTRLVLVDVTATDHSGKPVNDLKKEDFEVRESGKPQKIVGFAFQPPPSANSTAAKPPQLAPGVYTNIRTLNGESGPPTILLIDALNTPFRDQAYLRQQLVKYLEHIEPRRNVAIYTLGTHLRMIQDFTSDPELLHEALKKITTQSSMFNGEQESLEDDFPGLDPNSSDQAVAQMAQRLNEFEAEQQTYQRDLQVRLTMDAMEQLARNVSGYGGRKNLVWLSGAFPLTVFPDETLQNPFSAQSNYGDDLRRIAALFSANQIAVYPVDARGLVGSLMPDASQRATSMAGMRGGPNAMRTLQRSSANLSSSHDTMNELASQTGGRAFYNRNDIDHAIALSVDAGSTYYTLAYYPEDKQMNGKFRKIDVSIDRKGLQTHYRRGYFASEGTAK